MSLPRNETTNSLLDPDQIIATIERLRLRIHERFPESSLLRVGRDCLVVARQARERAEFVSRPIYWLRTVIWLVIAVIVLGVPFVAIFLPQHLWDLTENWETIDAVTHVILLAVAGVYFLVSLEQRFKRRRALSAIHELRAIAHIIDMHQLTKDPERLLKSWVSSEHSPQMTMTAFELGRYLDYCSELLSLTGKIAAVYVQRFDDEVAIEAVNEVATLTSNLCAQIWQKTVLLQTISQQLAETPPPATTQRKQSDAAGALSPVLPPGSEPSANQS